MAALPLKDFNLILQTKNPAKKITFQWSIRNFNKLPESIRSSKFSLVSGKPQEWDVCICRESDGTLQASLAYHAQKDAIPVEVKSVSRILKNKGSMLESGCQCTNLFYGGDQCPLLIPTKYPVSEDDKLIFHCSMTVHGYDLICSRNLYDDDDDQDVEEIRNNYLSMLKSEKLSDVMIRFEERWFTAHKCVLKTLAPKFYKFYQVQIHRGELYLKGIRPELFNLVLQSLYYGKVDKMVLATDSLQIYDLAKSCELMCLFRESIREIIYSMNAENVCQVYMRAEKSKDERLMKYCVGFMKDNLRDLDHNIDYNQIAASRPHLPKPNPN